MMTGLTVGNRIRGLAGMLLQGAGTRRLRHTCIMSAVLSVMSAGCGSSVAVPVHRLVDGNLRTIVGRVFWVDDETLAFAAQLESDRIDFDSDDPVNIYLWRPGKGGESLFRPAVWASSLNARLNWFCAGEGRLSYSVSRGEPDPPLGGTRFRVSVGAPGNMRDGEIISYSLSGILGSAAPPFGITPRNSVWSPYGDRAGAVCDEHADPEMIGQFWAVTSSPGKIIAFRRRTEDLSFYDARLINRSTGEETPLPLPETHMSPTCVMSVPWMKATVAWSCRTSGTEPNSVWVIDPDTASVSGTEVPLMPSTTLLSPVPTAEGMMFISSGSADDDGLFTFRADQRHLVVPGDFDDAVVSPSGCRVALFEIPSGANEDRRLIVADICKG